ncbi:MAG: Phenylalanyl-tRNA synthetase alpha chain (EC [uncultured Campylobacterales bacterium]|uniref:Phenylalanine--tRNA ligase alpha subunit n=1 Tax=uncultured Campylobacterales bacterium TaxID=352960 RepID=A0A6S6SZD4_9BACT|nr:MAG: Phenylalanyl-tRNA synthetase alpha chain (EC [uncultured Campylobacterales bacterium]
MKSLLIDLVNNTKNLKELELTKSKIFGKNGILTAEFKKLKTIEPKEKKDFAANINDIKQSITLFLEEKKRALEVEENDILMQKDAVDVTMFKSDKNRGAMHPVNETMKEIIDYFLNLNFSIEDGPLVEDDFHNFEALNLPKHHPARDMQDTFYFKDEKLLRTHTSPVQIRTMKDKKPPIRMISPGSVFRRDFDLTHTPMFHQVEGLVVDDEDKVSFSNLKSLLEEFLKHMFGSVDVRFRPSFFPFTEPSAEVDISCIFCKGKGCRVCSKTGWLEVLGCGLIDPNVFKAVGYEGVSGYAFGLGVERFTMLLREIPDLRSLYEGDLRLLEQFR